MRMMEKKLETTITGYIGIIGYILGLQTLLLLSFQPGSGAGRLGPEPPLSTGLLLRNLGQVT